MKYFPVVVFVVLGGSFLSCSKDDPLKTDSDLSAIDLTVGSENRYLYILTEDSSGVEKETYRDTVAVRIESDGQTLAGYSDLVKIKAYKVSNETLYANSWYRQTNAECIDFAYQYAGRAPVVFPKHGSIDRYNSRIDLSIPSLLRGITMSYRAFRDTTVRTDPRYVYKYPLSNGKSWIAFTDPFMQTREVKGNETVVLPSGTYRCTKISSAIPSISATLEWYDYISREGLIVRIISDSLVITTENNPDGDGIKRKMTQRFELIQRIP